MKTLQELYDTEIEFNLHFMGHSGIRVSLECGLRGELDAETVSSIEDAEKWLTETMGKHHPPAIKPNPTKDELMSEFDKVIGEIKKA